MKSVYTEGQIDYVYFNLSGVLTVPHSLLVAWLSNFCLSFRCVNWL